MGNGVAGVILAGGRSMRMGGGDKCLRPLSGQPILTRIIERLGPQVDAVALNANGDPTRFADFSLPTTVDPIPGLGPLGGVLAGLRWAQGNAHGISHVVSVACDTPFFPRDLVKCLREATETPGDIAQASSGGRIHPTFALWPVSLIDDLESFLRQHGPASMQAYAGDLHRPKTVDFTLDGDRDPFFNINTPEDHELAKQWAKMEQ